MTVGGYPDRNIVLCVGAIMVVAALAFWELLGVIIIAGTLAVVLLPIQRFLIRKINPFISSFLIAGLVVLVASSAIGFTIAIFYTHADYISYLIDTILTWFGAIGAAGTPTISQTEMNEWIILQLDTLSAWSTSLVYEAPMILVKILVFLMALMAFLYKSDEIYRELIGVLPGRLSSAFIEVSKVAVDTLYAIYVV
ncbi:AI-2E family transporter, partial [Candidatus Nomurabacteria bacterium]|nr:AI-2E family transporter [Candidatus Nomurabacteria bacterium]